MFILWKLYFSYSNLNPKVFITKKIKVVYIFNSGFPDPKISFSSIRITWYLIGRINNLILFLLPQRNIFLIVNPPYNSLSRESNKNLYLPFPSFDYDIYKQEINKISFKKEEIYIVFLDEMYTDHPDIKFSKTVNIESQTNIYYKEVNKFLKYIANRFNREVIIAKHPKHEYEIAKERYDFKVSKKKTIEEVSRAFCVISHTSNSINMAIMMKKPVILLQTSAHKFYKLHIETLKELSKNLELKIIKSYISYEISQRDLNINREKFEEYISKYITSSNNLEETNILLKKYMSMY